MADQSVYKTLRLHISADKFYIEPRDPKSLGEKILEIDRVTQELNLTENEGQIPPSAETKDIFGIMGVIHLLAGPYLIVITRKRLVGYIQGSEIWKVLGTEVLPFPRALLHLTEDQSYYNKIYLSMVTSVLQTDGFYFSCSYDITHTIQRLSATSPDFLQMPLYERADPRFVWNNHLLRPFAVQPELHRFILPVLHGFINITSSSINNKSFDFVLISRRSCYRAGVRYYIRGLDDEGRSANYVETEQIIQHNNGTSSFVQIRGSIPLYWSQRPNLKYKPKPLVNSTADHKLGFRYHIDQEIAHYRELVLISLIDQKPPEKVLGDNFGAVIRNSGYEEDRIRYDAFDFHKECSKMRWDRLNILIDRQNSNLKKFGYFSMDKDRIINSEQKGIFRTNCIDSLDRTNVVQSMLASKSLEFQLEEHNVISTGEKLTQHKDFEFVFKNVWADNADACSLQYAGTGALKTDFTRTGKRSVFGALKDGVNSAIRYYKNNFSDGYRQDSIDLFLGNYVVDSNECINKPCPLQQKRDWRYMMLPLTLLFGFSMFIISVILPSTDYGIQFLYILFWGISVLITLYIVIFFGTEFVDQPKLLQRKDVKDKHV